MDRYWNLLKKQNHKYSDQNFRYPENEKIS